MIHAPTGLGKSWLALSIAVAVAGGGTIHSWKSDHPARVLYLDGEMDAADLKTRLGSLVQKIDGVDRAALGRNFLLMSRHDQPHDAPEFPDLGEEEGQTALLHRVWKAHPELVVIDNVSTLVTLADENAGDSWNSFLGLLQDLQRAGTAVVVVHHSRKSIAVGQSGGYRGSSKLAVLFDNIIALHEDPAARGHEGAAFQLSFEKARTLVSEGRSGLAFRLGTDGWETETKFDPGLISLVDRLRGLEFATQREIAEALGVDPAQVTRTKRKAIDAGLITREQWEQALVDARDERFLSSTTTSMGAF